MKNNRRRSSWYKVIIIIGVFLICFRIDNVAFSQTDPIADGLDALNLVVDTLTSVGETLVSVMQTAGKIALGIYALEALKMAGQLSQVASEGTKYDQTDIANTQNNMSEMHNQSVGNESNFTNQLANYNQQTTYPSSDKNQITGKTITYSATSANTLIGGNKVHSSTQETAAKSFVVNSSGAGVGLSAPSQSWRVNTTPEAVRYNAFYNLTAANQSQTTNALTGLQSKTTKVDSQGNTTSSSSQMSADVAALAYCDPNNPNAFDAVKNKPLMSLACMVGGVLNLAPTLIPMAVSYTITGIGMLGSLNSTASTATTFTMLDPMHKQATDAAAGSEANAYKKSSG